MPPASAGGLRDYIPHSEARFSVLFDMWLQPTLTTG
jgi:hypothetical protein